MLQNYAQNYGRAQDIFNRSVRHARSWTSLNRWQGKIGAGQFAEFTNRWHHSLFRSSYCLSVLSCFPELVKLTQNSGLPQQNANIFNHFLFYIFVWSVE